MVRIYTLLSILLTGIFFSCNDRGNFDIGTGLVDTESSIYETRDFKVGLSTVALDSIYTARSSRLIVGKRLSDVVGSVEAVSYFSLNMNVDLASINKNEVGEFLDSVKMVLPYSDFFIGDTTKQLTLQLFRLTERLKLAKNDGGDNLYNTSSFPHENTPLVEYSFFPTVNKNDSLVFHVDLGFGQELIDFDQNYMDKGDSHLDAKEKYQNYIKGFALKLKADNTILSFDTIGVKFDIYTHIPEYYARVKKYTVSMASGTFSDSNHFIQAITDRSSTAFSTLTDQKEKLLSVDSGDKTFIQGLGGVVTRIDFPNMNDIFAYSDRVMVKAELILYASEKNDTIPRTLNFFESNKQNIVGSVLEISFGSSNQRVVLNANKRADKNHFDRYYYSIDITRYLTSKLGNYQFDTNNGLIVSTPILDLRSKADVLILNGENTPINFSPKLKLYFLKYE